MGRYLRTQHKFENVFQGDQAKVGIYLCYSIILAVTVGI